ncbi:MAG: NnrU family protein, partial [Psychromonas sp.]
MALLLIGLLIWIVVHLIPSLQVNIKIKLVDAIGENGYKGIFTLSIIIALALIIIGWRSSVPTQLYYLQGPVRTIAMLFLPFAFILFAAANYPTRIKQYIRHPQLTGLLIWA